MCTQAQSYRGPTRAAVGNDKAKPKARALTHDTLALRHATPPRTSSGRCATGSEFGRGQVCRGHKPHRGCPSLRLALCLLAVVRTVTVGGAALAQCYCSRRAWRNRSRDHLLEDATADEELPCAQAVREQRLRGMVACGRVACGWVACGRVARTADCGLEGLCMCMEGPRAASAHLRVMPPRAEIGHGEQVGASSRLLAFRPLRCKGGKRAWPVADPAQQVLLRELQAHIDGQRRVGDGTPPVVGFRDRVGVEKNPSQTAVHPQSQPQSRARSRA